MAYVCPLHLHVRTTTTLAQRHCSPSYLFTKCRTRSILCFHNIQTDRNSRSSFKDESTTRRRREVLIQILFSAAAAASLQSIVADSASASVENDVEWSKPSAAGPIQHELLLENNSYLKEDFRTYSDEMNKFQISIPQEWLVGTGEPNGYKSVTAFYPKEASNSNVSVVITGLGPDFTRLESFGKVDAFAETLVSGLDRSWQRPPGVEAKLIDSKAANGLYYIEYSLKNPGERCRHLYSAIGMASNGWYNRLYTVTGQFVEEESEKYRPAIEKSVLSFRLF